MVGVGNSSLQADSEPSLSALFVGPQLLGVLHSLDQPDELIEWMTSPSA